MRTIGPLILSCIVLVGCSKNEKRPEKNPITFTLPANWKVEHADGRLYALNAQVGEGLLMFSQSQFGRESDDSSEWVRQLAIRFLEQNQKTNVPLKSQVIKIEQFTGENCHGSYAEFHFDSDGTPAVQSMFRMSVGGDVWDGQFTGGLDLWAQALVVLKSVKSSR